MRMIDLTAKMLPEYRDMVPSHLPRFDRIVAPRMDEVVRPEVEGRELAMGMYGAPLEHLPDGDGFASEMMTLSTHCGTHVDAPLHSGSVVEGKPARTMSDIDINELLAPGIVLDMRPWAEPNRGFEVGEIEQAIKATGTQVSPGDAVLIRTGQERYANDQPEFYEYPGMTGEGTRYLTSLGAKILSSDSLAWDRPTSAMVKAYQETGDPKHIWDGHYAVKDREAFIVQKIANLAALPVSGFSVGFFPMNLHATSAAPCRAVAFVEG